MKSIFLFLSLAIILSSCAIIPERGVPLERFVHNLSQDMDCLVYCAQMAHEKKREKAGGFFLKDPLEIELGVTREGRVSASASPSVFSLVGLSLEGNEGQVGKLSLKLLPLERCKRLEVDLLDDAQGQKNGCKPNDVYPKKLFFKGAALFFEIINGKEYLYVQGQEIDKKEDCHCHQEGSHEVVTRRFELSRVSAIRCEQKRFAKGEMPWCKCPRGPKE